MRLSLVNRASSKAAFNSCQGPASPGQRLERDTFQGIAVCTEEILSQPLADILFHSRDHAFSFGNRAGFGSDADIHNTGVGGQAHGWVVERFQVADLVIERAFPDPADVQRADFDDLVQD